MFDFDEKIFNNNSDYDLVEYLTPYEQSKYKNEYNYDRKQNPHKYKEFKKDFIKKEKENPNICK